MLGKGADPENIEELRINTPVYTRVALSKLPSPKARLIFIGVEFEISKSFFPPRETRESVQSLNNPVASRHAC